MKTITRYQCDFCAKHYARKADTRRHEKHCWRNAARTPRQGEVYGLDHDNYGKGWEPDNFGMIYVDGEWHEVRGYSFEQEQDMSGEYYPTGETWPKIDTQCEEGVPMNKAPRDSRVAWWRRRQTQENHPLHS